MYKGDGADNVNRAIQEVLKPLHADGVTAVIAGGFMRDNAMNKPWRDIDLYISAAQWEHAGDMLKLDDTFGEGTETLIKGEREYDHQSIMFQGEFHSPVMGGVTINLIGLHSESITPRDVTAKFNLGVCMAATDGYTAHLDNRFLRDIADQQITLYRPDWGHEATLKQWVKLQAKYPWPLRLAQPDW